jgi:hypothetical protein
MLKPLRHKARNVATRLRPRVEAARRQTEPTRLTEGGGLGDTQLASDRRIRQASPELAQLGDAVGGPERWAAGAPARWRATLPSGSRTLPVRATSWRLITILPMDWQPAVPSLDRVSPDQE